MRYHKNSQKEFAKLLLGQTWNAGSFLGDGAGARDNNRSPRLEQWQKPGPAPEAGSPGSGASTGQAKSLSCLQGARADPHAATDLDQPTPAQQPLLEMRIRLRYRQDRRADSVRCCILLEERRGTHLPNLHKNTKWGAMALTWKPGQWHGVKPAAFKMLQRTLPVCQMGLEVPTNQDNSSLLLSKHWHKIYTFHIFFGKTEKGKKM